MCVEWERVPWVPSGQLGSLYLTRMWTRLWTGGKWWCDTALTCIGSLGCSANCMRGESVSGAPEVRVFPTWTLPEPHIVFCFSEAGKQVKIWLSLQTFRDPAVTLLVCVRSAESLRHQRQSQTWVHWICWGHYVWDLQRHLPRCAAEHAHSHDEQLVPAHCRKLSHSLFLLLFFSMCLICLAYSKCVSSRMLETAAPSFWQQVVGISAH